MEDYLAKAIELKGRAAIARACGRSITAVRKWEAAGLPRTEFTGETEYAAKIAKLCKNKVTKRQLLSMPRKSANGVPVEEAPGEVSSVSMNRQYVAATPLSTSE